MSVFENLPEGSARNKAEYLAKEIDKAVAGASGVDVSACIAFDAPYGESVSDYMSFSNRSYNDAQKSHHAALYHRENEIDGEPGRRLEIKSAIDLLAQDEPYTHASLLMGFTVAGEIALDASITSKVNAMGTPIFCRIGIKPKGRYSANSFFLLPAAYSSAESSLKFEGTADVLLSVQADDVSSIEDSELQFFFQVLELGSGTLQTMKDTNSQLDSFSGFIDVKKGWVAQSVE